MKQKLLKILEGFESTYSLTEGEQITAIDNEYFIDVVNAIIESNKNLLYEFWQRSSDACPLEINEAEKQEKMFSEWISNNT